MNNLDVVTKFSLLYTQIKEYKIKLKQLRKVKECLHKLDLENFQQISPLNREVYEILIDYKNSNFPLEKEIQTEKRKLQKELLLLYNNQSKEGKQVLNTLIGLSDSIHIIPFCKS